jgi:UDP-MurNAc hydroxylase
LLSLRFSAYWDPDIYNDHLLGLLKFNDGASLRVIEAYEKRETPESIVVDTAGGSRYEIARYCPHAGAALDNASIEGHILTCLNHHYRFDLDSGKCLDGN